MGKLECQCGAKAEAETFEEADAMIDHGIARLIGNGCDGDPTKMTWDGKPVATKAILMLVETTKPKNMESTNSVEEDKPTKPKQTKKSKGQ